MNMLQQQIRFDAFESEFNRQRPHEALNMRTRKTSTAPRPEPITPCPRSTILPREMGPGYLLRAHQHASQEDQLSVVMAGQKLGIKEVDDSIWLVSFIRYDLG